MQTSIDFLKAIGHTDRVYINLLTSKNTPLTELQKRGMTYTSKKTSEIKKCVISGYLDLNSGEFFQKYGEKYKPFGDGWGHIHNLNQQGYGVYFNVHHGGTKSGEITHGTVLFHESDKATFEEQQKEIDRISVIFGKPTFVVRTRKSLHAYWLCSEIIPIDLLPSLQRRWMQYSNCDDDSLADPGQLMRVAGLDHIAWNPKTNDFDRVPCEIIQSNPDAKYSLEQFDRALPELDISKLMSRSLEAIPSDATDRDMRSFVPYLDGYLLNGRDGWITAKCPAHDGESDNSLHINQETGSFICHAGCTASAVYQAVKAKAVAAGHRLDVIAPDPELAKEIVASLAMKSNRAPKVFEGKLGDLLGATANNFNVSSDIFTFILLPILGSQIPPEARLMINPGTNFQVPALRWCGLVGESGVKKSPLLDTLMAPIKQSQKKLSEEYRDKKAGYKLEINKWKSLTNKERLRLITEGISEPEEPSEMRDLYMDDFTMESIAKSLSRYPDNGLLVYVDELKGFFESMDSYRKGGDRQKWLSINNGGAIKVNRSGANTIYIHQSSIGIIGGIQPSVLEATIKGDGSADDGLWSRFTFVRLPRTKIEAFTDYPGDLSDLLSRVYSSLSIDKRQNYLSDESKPLWKAWHDEIEKRVFNEQNSLLCAVLAKINGIAARNALIIHRTLAAIASTTPEQAISAEVVQVTLPTINRLGDMMGASFKGFTLQWLGIP